MNIDIEKYFPLYRTVMHNTTMNIFKLLFCLILAFSLHSIACENEDEVIDREMSQIIQLAIDAPELQQYFHAESDVGRVPLKISLPKELSSLSLSGVSKFGVPVEIVKENSSVPNFEITQYLVSSTGVKFIGVYEIEGVVVRYMFEKDDENNLWVLINAELAER